MQISPFPNAKSLLSFLLKFRIPTCVGARICQLVTRNHGEIILDSVSATLKKHDIESDEPPRKLRIREPPSRDRFRATITAPLPSSVIEFSHETHPPWRSQPKGPLLLRGCRPFWSSIHSASRCDATPGPRSRRISIIMTCS